MTSYKRTICDVDIQGVVLSGCLGDEQQWQKLAERLNGVLGARGTVRLRLPDPKLSAGTPHGYLAAVQRDRRELFSDQFITKDRSVAVPALEFMTYQGDGGAWGAGRQVVQLAGVQASTSYGIACLYGRRADGVCVRQGDPAEGTFAPQAPPSTEVNSNLTAGGGGFPGEAAADSGAPRAPRENLVTRILKAIPRAIADTLRLLFNNPRELGLLLALWTLLYGPCYLGDRRRAIREVAARRLAAG